MECMDGRWVEEVGEACCSKGAGRGHKLEREEQREAMATRMAQVAVVAI